jgi:alkylated DNA repair dioxygenase AlkB
MDRTGRRKRVREVSATNIVDTLSLSSDVKSRIQIYYEEKVINSNLIDSLLQDLDIETVGGWNRQGQRYVRMFGDEGVIYRYHGNKNPVPEQPWPNSLILIKHRLEEYASDLLGMPVTFNLCVANLYQGRDGLRAHSDKEHDLVPRTPILSFSVGAARKFQFHYVEKPFQPCGPALLLAHNSVLIMSKETQFFTRHSVPRDTGCKELRVNLTFRLAYKHGQTRSHPSHPSLTCTFFIMCFFIMLFFVIFNVLDKSIEAKVEIEGDAESEGE